MELNIDNIKKLIEFAIDEDIKNGDITTASIVTDDKFSESEIKVKQDGIIAGLQIAKLVVDYFDKQAIWQFNKSDGDHCKKGEIIAKVKAKCGALLSSERIVLNFLQRMSGIATKTNEFVSKLEGLKTKILDTRKTIPGHRLLDKYAVKTGGGENHRMGLYDMVMIKDNHIKLAGSISNAVELVKKKFGSNYRIEVETSSLDEVKEALKYNIDLIMLDNMSLKEMKKAVRLCKGKVLTEASGNITLKNVREVAETGVDFISAGELTHSVQALDISMEIVGRE